MSEQSAPVPNRPDMSIQVPEPAKPKVKFGRAVGLLLSCRFADFTEYVQNGDTEN